MAPPQWLQGFPKLRQECEVRGKWDLPSFHALLLIPSCSSFSLIHHHVSPRLSPWSWKGLSRWNLLFKWDRKKERKMSGVPPKTLCASNVLFGILSVQPPAFVQSLCPHDQCPWPMSHLCAVSKPNAKAEYEVVALKSRLLWSRKMRTALVSSLLTGSFWTHKAQRNVVCSST